MISFLGVTSLMRPGAFFAAILLGMYTRISTAPSYFWQYRDDSVIHLSHAKNFVLFGSIGLSPGDRTEAMSSPLNYLISQVWFFISPDMSYKTYLNGYNFGVLILFALSYTFCVTQILSTMKKVQESLYWLIAISPLGMVLASWTTFGWMISGMENALGASLILLVLGLTFKAQEATVGLISFLIILLGIARIEFAVLLLPFFAGILCALRSTKASVGRLLLDLSPIFLVWGFIHGARYLYFGQISPNTAQALGKSASLSMAVYLVTQFYLLSRLLGLTKSLKTWIGYGVGWIHIATFILIVRSNLGKSDFHFAPSLVVSGLVLIVAVIAFTKLQPSLTMQLAILLLIGQLNEYFLFGPARLSEFRIVAIFVPGLLLLILKIFLEYFELSNFGRKEFFLVCIVSLVPLAFLFLTKVDPVRNLCCRISPSENLIMREMSGFLRENGLSREAKPISASPDLGKVSFAKEAMIIDLGLIGDPLLGDLSIKHPEKVAMFLNDFVGPDIVESHGFWSCRYSEFLESTEFKRRYQLAYSGIVSSEFNFPPQTVCPFSGKYSIWKRILPIVESKFAQKLNKSPVSEFPTLIRQEAVKCSQENSELQRCQYVYRGILRELERVNKSEIRSQIFNSLKLSPTYKLDVIRLEKKPNWASEAEKELLGLTS
jgi:hypothetical protein